jgi:hypothetical protein
VLVGARAGEPAAPRRLQVEVAAVHTWTRALALQVEARGAGGALLARERLGASLVLRVEATAADPPRFSLSLAGVELTHAPEGGEELRWTLPSGVAPPAFQAACDPQGRLLALEGETLRAQLAARGCDPRLAKLAQLYVFGLERGGRRADGALLGAGPLLPGERDDARRWSGGGDLLYGLGGLSQDLVGAHERWSWTAREGPPGQVALEGVLAEVKVVRHFGGAPLDASELSSSASAALEPATGLLVRCEARWAFTLSDGQARVRVERHERLDRRRE